MKAKVSTEPQQQITEYYNKVSLAFILFKKRQKSIVKMFFPKIKNK